MIWVKDFSCGFGVLIWSLLLLWRGGHMWIRVEDFLADSGFLLSAIVVGTRATDAPTTPFGRSMLGDSTDQPRPKALNVVELPFH